MAKQRKSNRYYTGMLAYTETPKTMRRRRIYSKICLILAILCMGGFFYMLVTDSFPGTGKNRLSSQWPLLVREIWGRVYKN